MRAGKDLFDATVPLLFFKFLSEGIIPHFEHLKSAAISI